MWLQVDPNDDALLQRGIESVRLIQPEWNSMTVPALKARWAAVQAEAFHYRDANVRLFIGFEFVPSTARWTMVCAGIDGLFTPGRAMTRFLDKAREFLAAKGIASCLAIVPKEPSTLVAKMIVPRFLRDPRLQVQRLQDLGSTVLYMVKPLPVPSPTPA